MTLAPASGPRVALIVDHPQRDLAGLVLTAYELCQQGITCHLVPLNLQEREVWALAPDFVLLNYLRLGNEVFARNLDQAGIAFGLLDTEGGIWTDCDAYAELLWNDAALLGRVRRACMWGPELAGHLVAGGILASEQVVVTGCPRFDFYHPRWRTVLDDGERGAPGILINTNFSMTNPRFASAEQNLEQYRSVFGWPEVRVREFADAEREAIEGMISLARDLARDFPRHTVVVRPHPFEDPARYRRALTGIANVIVRNAGPVQPAIYRAAAVIQRSCSTAVEAGLAGVPALSPQWLPAPALVPSAEAVSLPCVDYAEMRDAVGRAVRGEYCAPVNLRRTIDRVTEGWFWLADGLAHLRVQDAVTECLEGPRRVDERFCSELLHGLSGRPTFAADTLARRLRRRLHLSPDFAFRRMRTVPPAWWLGGPKRYDVDDVRRLTERVRRAYKLGGHAAAPVDVGLARDRGDYVTRLRGYSVTMAPAAS